MRRKKIADPTERYSVLRALRAIDRSDVVLMVINAQEGVTEQDKRIVGYAHEQGKGCILVVNKWDLIEKMIRHYINLKRKFVMNYYFTVCTHIFVSALTKQRVNKILEIVDFVAEQQAYRVNTSTLNQVISEAVQLNPPPSEKGKNLKILYVTQAGIKPPSFVIFVNEPEIMHFSYERYLENKIRENFGFEGTPIRFIIRKRDE